MKLTDALAQLRGTADQTHKFWGYYQAVTVAAVGFIWATKDPPRELVIGLVAAYLVFAFLNCRLIVSSQSAASTIWTAIQKYEPPPEEPIPAALRPITALNEPDDPTLIGAMHVSLSVLAALAMHARIGSSACGT